MSTITDKAQATSARPIRSRSEWLNIYLKPQEPIPPQIYFAAMVITVLLLFVLWSALTYTKLVNPLFLPTPSDVIAALVKVVGNGSLWANMQASLVVILIGWALAVLVAVPV